jgi:hypothetical protein
LDVIVTKLHYPNTNWQNSYQTQSNFQSLMLK